MAGYCSSRAPKKWHDASGEQARPAGMQGRRRGGGRAPRQAAARQHTIHFQKSQSSCYMRAARWRLTLLATAYSSMPCALGQPPSAPASLIRSTRAWRNLGLTRASLRRDRGASPQPGRAGEAAFPLPASDHRGHASGRSPGPLHNLQQQRCTHCAVFSARPMPVKSLSASASCSSLLAMATASLRWRVR